MRLDRVKKEGEAGCWEEGVWFMTDVVAVVSTAVTVDVVAIFDASYGCFIGFAMGMLRSCCSHSSTQRPRANSALCAADNQIVPSLCLVVWSVCQ